ncbi:MAG TPA: tetratricopeptide repeat protein [Anaeromyxobacteraceae bacterium]|nr:tetratricopeptide repeat protein [Anaeromyxobacteraceae bacterium]
MRPASRGWVALLVAAGCAASSGGKEPAAGAARSQRARAPEASAAAFDDWLLRADAAAAATRFRSAAERDPLDPWAHLGEAMLAERSLDEPAEAEALRALLAAAPDHPLAPVAVRRLAEIGLGSPRLLERADAALAGELAASRLHGLAAYRARVARAVFAEVRGRSEEAARQRRDNGSVSAWSLAGPFGAYHALEFDEPFAPEKGPWLPRFERSGQAPVESRTLPAPDGAPSLDGEPLGGDVFYLASDLRLERGGGYLLALGSSVSMKAFLDGEPMGERRAFEGWPATVQVVPVALPPGTHRLLVKLTRGHARATFAVSLARKDGAPSDAAWTAAAGGGGPVRAGHPPSPLLPARALSDALAPEAGPALARLVAARDRIDVDRQASIALLDEAQAMLPRAAPVRSARAAAVVGDPSQADRTAHARAEADWREALRIDPGDAATRVALAELALSGDRLDDAQALLSGLSDGAARRPAAMLLRSRLLSARSFSEAAEALALEAWQRDGSCAGASLVLEMASRRDALTREDESAAALAACPGGKERLAEHLRIRGDLGGAERAWSEVARASPAREDARLALARVLVAEGRPDAAAAELEGLSRVWPRDPRLLRRLAEVLELAGHPSAARAARERALALDGSDLTLRRALALEDGTEVLAALAEDGPKTMRAYEADGKRPPTSAALVLDAAAVETYPDGSHTERVHQVIQVLDTKGVEKWGEVEVPGGAALLQLKTWKRDGRVLEAEDPGGDKRTLSAAGLEPGDYLEVEWMRGRSTRGPAVPGWSADPFFFKGEDLPFFHSTYAVAGPAGTLEVDARHRDAPRVVREGDRDVVRADAWRVPAEVPEPDSPSMTEFFPMVQVGSGAGLEAAALAAADVFADRLRRSQEIEALAASVALPEGAAKPLSGEVLLRAAYDRVMEKVEGSGSLADQAAHVVSRGRGSRTLALLALLKALGIPARLVLVRPFYADPASFRFPRLDLYSQAVIRARVDGRTFCLDPSVRWAPFGLIPSAARGVDGLALPGPGEPLEAVRTPADAGEDRYEVELKISLHPDGSALLEGSERFTGFDAAGAKAALEQVDARGRRQVVEHGLARTFRGLALETLEFEGERRTGEPLVIRYRARVPGLARASEGRLLVDAVPFPARLGARFAQLGTREAPLLIAADERAAVRVVVVPPQGLVPEPQKAREVAGAQGRYRREERVVDGALVRQDRIELSRARVAVADYAAFARFATEVDEAQAVPMDVGAAPGQ